ncbi:MAG: membrane dipeptidase [Bacteroidetes bacterium HGW-Bacteroidetes-5]|jgi:membrane dipeptidase|nr:MAG: membrane dipeptidase [Bacteroidetes bacterium HGW-Bacteroidetes-5]
MSYKKLHQSAFVLDSHCDTPLVLIDGANLGERLHKGHFDFIRMREGGLDAVFFAIYTSGKLEPDAATRRALQLIARTFDAVESNSDKVTMAFSAEDAYRNREMGLGSVFIGMENGAPIQKDLSLLRLFYDMGIRYMTLCHAADNEICDSCASKDKRWNGLSPFGIEVVKEMNRLGMLIDVSHISDQSFYDVLKYTTKPVVATHSCCRSIANHPRNLTDQMIVDLASNGGVIQINFYPPFLNSDYAKDFWPLCDAFEEAQDRYREDPKKFKKILQDAEKAMLALERPSFTEIADHIDHVVKLVGVKHVGIGSDFDGIEVTPVGMEGVDKLPVLTKELKSRGYSDDDIKLILGENFLRLL